MSDLEVYSRHCSRSLNSAHDLGRRRSTPFYSWVCNLFGSVGTGKNRVPLQIMEISTSNKFPNNFHTMEVSKRLEVDFQQISLPWKCPKGWNLPSNKFPYHGSVQKVGICLPTNFHTMEVSKRLEVSWKFVGSRNDFHDISGEDTIFPMGRERRGIAGGVN